MLFSSESYILPDSLRNLPTYINIILYTNIYEL